MLLRKAYKRKRRFDLTNNENISLGVAIRNLLYNNSNNDNNENNNIQQQQYSNNHLVGYGINNKPINGYASLSVFNTSIASSDPQYQHQ